MGIGRWLFYLVEFICGREVIYNLFPKFHAMQEGFSFYGPRKSDKGADTNLIYIFAGLTGQTEFTIAVTALKLST